MVPEGPNRIALQAISKDWAVAISVSGSGSDALERGVPPIIVYDRELSPEHWSDSVRALAKKSPRPYIILLSSTADANLWDELERAGGAEILRTPVDRERLLWALVKGWQLWRTQQLVRPHAADVRR
jgi:hypothetical protein